MESNKSKGVQWEALRDRFFMECCSQHEFPKVDMTPHGVFEWFKTELLAHPQQSEATLTDHAISIGTPIQTTAAASEGVGRAASGPTKQEILDEAQRHYEDNGISYPESLVHMADWALKFKSEPAALKDGEERAIREIWNKYSGTTWVVPPEKFTAALKEFASLLTNHKS